MSVHKKLMEARIRLQKTELKKTGFNKFAGYYYFTLADFAAQVQAICSELKLCGVVSYTTELATLNIIDMEDGSSITITSPMAEANLKGCHPIQNIGAVETYQRRYLWVTAMEMVEFEILDATAGGGTKSAAATGLLDNIPLARMAILESVKAAIIDAYNAGSIKDAHDAFYEVSDNEEKMAMWSMLKPFSKLRSAVKTYHEQREQYNGQAG